MHTHAPLPLVYSTSELSDPLSPNRSVLKGYPFSTAKGQPLGQPLGRPLGRDLKTSILNVKSILKVDAIGGAGEGNHIPDVAHAGHELHQTLEAEAKSGVGHGAKTA